MSRASYRTLYVVLRPKMRSKSEMLETSVAVLAGPESDSPTTNETPRSVGADWGTGVDLRTTSTEGRSPIYPSFVSSVVACSRASNYRRDKGGIDGTSPLR